MASPEFSNRLTEETSPYLLQHAHNPVDWYPWGPEALEKAKREDKPIFLSIGYSACHWCHVMAHESFEDPETAKIMNARFVNIKIDREERPDIDALYMKALIALTGHGGWPMSLFLTPDQQPYFGGTYFPPAKKYNRPGFDAVLEEAHDLYHNRNAEVQNRTGRIFEQIQTAAKEPPREGLGFELIDEAAAILAERFDADFGGFGSGMKFPEPMHYGLLLRHWLRTESQTSLEILDKSLTKMAEGGIFDQLGGGFHRYSTDRKWLVPHFEKMLYDNALLGNLFLDMFQATKQDIYKETAQRTLDYVLREMTTEEGVFCSSQDADTEGEEGTFYVWELKDVLNALGPRHAKIFARAYGITAAGNFQKKNVLHVKDSMETIAEEESVPIFEVQHVLKSGLKTLYDVRNKRQRPFRDEKNITAWNGLVIHALANGYAILHEKKYLDAASRAAGFIWQNLWTDTGLKRIHKNGVVRIDGCLDDHAYLLEGLIALYEASFEIEWIDRAVLLADRMIEQFWDAKDGGFFMTGNDHEKLITRLKTAADEAIPSANAKAALALFKLAHLTGKDEYAKKGKGVLQAFLDKMEKSPAAYSGCLAALDFHLTLLTEVVFAGPREHPAFAEMQTVLQEDYRPNKITLWNESEAVRERIPLAEGKSAIKGEPAVYLCKQGTCHAPVQSGEALRKQLGRPPEIRLNIFDAEKHAKEIRSKEEANFLGAMSEIFKHSGLGGKRK